jgi:hypothetical protein
MIQRTEFSYQVGLLHVRRPFGIRDVSIAMNNEPISHLTLAELIQASFGFIYLFNPFLYMAISASKIVFKGREPGVKLNNT